MYLLVQSPRSNIANTRFSLHSVCKNQAHESSFKRTFRWGCSFEPPCLSAGRLDSSRQIVHLGSDEYCRQCHRTQRGLSGKFTVATPAGFATHRSSLRQVFQWNILDSPWIFQRWQRLLEQVRARTYCRIQDCAAATVAVIVVQAIIAQDVAHALSLTCPNLLEPRSLVDFTVSPWTNTSSISCCGAQLDSVRCGTKKLTPGKASLVRMRAYATPTMNGAFSRRQGRGKGFEGIARGVDGELMATNASSAAVKASPLALITGSLTSPLASIVNAGSHVDLNVLRASFASSLNLISLCSFVLWMQRSGQLPAETPVVLSQVAFRVLIPCFLMTKVALTLASHPTASLLFLPLIAIAQVLMGALLGKAAYRYVNGESSAISPLTVGASMSVSSGSATIATSKKGSGVITQVEKPLGTINFRRHSEQYKATKKEAIITAACAFGNSFTLPLIFMTGVLGAEETSKVAGYLALYMVGWSPALWTVGYSVISTGDEDSDLGGSVPKDRFAWTTLLEELQRIMNPPLYGVLVGVLVGGTPLSHLFLPVANGSAMSVKSPGALAVLCSSTAGILRPVFDAAALLGTATLAVQTIVLASSLAASLRPLITTREAKRFSRGMEAVGSAPETEVGSCSAEQDAVLDTRAFWIISSVRLVAMPVIVIISTVILQRARILPVDPVYNLLLLAESAMPSAQNLVLLSQLRASTRRLSGVLADLLLRQYALSIIPITFWMALFLAIVKPA